MAVIKPYLVFGRKNSAPVGGMGDYIGAHFSIDEARASVNALFLEWWNIAVFLDDGLKLVEEYPGIPAKAEKKKGGDLSAEH